MGETAQFVDGVIVWGGSEIRTGIISEGNSELPN